MLIARRLLVLALFLICGLSLEAAEAKIVKVLPHYLDLEGRHSLSPSLYERDAYQAFLRKNPDKRSALRFEVQWKARANAGVNLKLRLEVRTSKNLLAKPTVLEQPVKKRRWLGNWSALLITGNEYRELGDVLAWRVSLWDGERQLSEEKSFLWQ